MKILTLENKAYNIEKIPEWVDEKLRFAVLDNADPSNPDFFYIPLIFFYLLWYLDLSLFKYFLSLIHI